MFHRLQVLLSSIVGCLALAACSSAPVGGNAVQVVTAVPEGCEYVGETRGGQTSTSRLSAGAGTSIDATARQQLRDRAAEMGGNVLFVVGQEQEVRVVVKGAIYRCPGAPVPVVKR